MKLKKFYEFSGWGAFTIGSIIYLIGNMLNGDIPGIVGSGVFLVGCIFFIISEFY